MKKQVIRSTIATLILLIFSFSMVLAAYTGPGNRSILTPSWKRHNCSVNYSAPGWSSSWYSRMQRYTSGACPGAYVSANAVDGNGEEYFCIRWADGYSEECQGRNLRWPSPQVDSINDTLEACTSGQTGCVNVGTPVVYNPATVSGVNSCTINGNNGWCKGVGKLTLSSTETIPGYSITKIETSTTTLCASGACAYTYPQGVTSLTYWAVSSFGDTSAQSTSSMSVDSVAPTSTVTLTGTKPSNWYNNTGSIVVTVTGTDGTSGVDTKKVNIISGPSVGLFDSPLTLTLDGDYSIQGVVTDMAGNVTNSTTTNLSVDRTAPDFSLVNNGSISSHGWYPAPFTVSTSGSDAKSGYDRTDFTLVDGSNASSSGSGMVSITTEGLNTVTFTGYDNAGNSIVHAFEFLLDKTNPTGQITLEGTLGNTPWYTSPVIIDVHGEDTVSGVYEKILVDPDSVDLTPPYAVTYQGTKVFNASIFDNAGNFVNTTPVSISMDTVHPSLDLLIYSGTLGLNGWYVGPVVIKANASDATSGIDHITPNSEVTISDDGTNNASFTAYDIAGNSTTLDLATPLKIDQTSPIPSFSINGDLINGWYNGNSDLVITPLATDATSGILDNLLKLDGSAGILGPVTYVTEGTHSFSVFAKDNAGNSSESSVQSFKLDRTPPTYTLYKPSLANSNDWYSSAVSLSVIGEDVLSGYSHATYVINGDLSGSMPVVVSSEGINDIDLNVFDTAGNFVSDSYSYKIDLTNPEITPIITGVVGLNGWYTSPVELDGLASDLGSGICSKSIKIGLSSWITAPVPFSTEGTDFFTARALDCSDRETLTSLTAIKVDTKSPIFTPVVTGTLGENGWYTSLTSAIANATDATSGIASVSPSDKIDLTDGIHDVSWTAVDVAGNSNSTALASSVKVDTQAPSMSPEFTGTLGLNGWYTSPVTIDSKAIDGTSGIYEVQPSAVAVLSDEGKNSIAFKAFDMAGNYSVSNLSAFIDSVKPTFAPTITGTHGNNGWYTSNVTAFSNAEDETSGISEVQPSASINYSLDGVYAAPTFTAYDNAGLSKSTTLASGISVDQTAPAIAFNNLPDPLVGNVTLSGVAQDSMSGLEKVEVSTNGGLTWTTVDVKPDGGWDMPFDTLLSIFKNWLIIAKATDNAGNSNTSSLYASFGAHPGTATLTPEWQISASGLLTITEGDVAFITATIDICDPFSRWECQSITYNKGEVPASIVWDGKFGINSADPGSYTVEVEVVDILGQKSTASGVIVIPVPASAPDESGTTTATLLPTTLPTLTPTEHSAGVVSVSIYEEPASATPTVAIVNALSDVIDPTPTPEQSFPSPFNNVALPIAVTGAVTASVGAAGIYIAGGLKFGFGKKLTDYAILLFGLFKTKGR